MCVLSFRVAIEFIYILYPLQWKKRKRKKYWNKKINKLKYTRKDERSDGVPVCTKLVRDAIAWGI